MKYVYEALVEWRRRKDNRSTWRETLSSATFSPQIQNILA